MVVTCICCLTIGLTACGEKAKTVKSVEVNSNGELVAIYDNEEKVTLGKLSNVRSAEEKDGKLVITLVDGKTIEVPTKIDVPEQVKSVRSITAANGVLTITYTDGTTETVKVADKAVKSVDVKDGKLVITLFDGTTEEVPLPSEKAVKDVTVVDGKIKVTYTDGTEEIVCKHENAVYHSLKHHSVNEAGELVEGYGIKLCPDCGATITVKEGHNLKETVVEPTCASVGYTAVKCVDGDGVKGCGYEEEHDPDKDVPMLDHDYGEYMDVVLTGNICENEYMRVRKCKNEACGHHVDYETRPAEGHDLKFTKYEDLAPINRPSATTKGKVTAHCDRCGDDVEFELPVLGSTDYKIEDASERNLCTDVGTNKYTIKFDFKGKQYEYSFNVGGAKGQHTFLGQKIDVETGIIYLTDEEVAQYKIIGGVEFTCDEDVKCTIALECEVCHVPEVIRIAKHHEDDLSTKDVEEGGEATCYKKGKYTVKCVGCDKTFEREEERIAHKFDKNVEITKGDDGKYTFDAECSTCTDELCVANNVDPAERKQHFDDVTGVKETKATCEAGGKYELTVGGEDIVVPNGEKLNGHVIAVDEKGEYVTVSDKEEDAVEYNKFTYKDAILKVTGVKDPATALKCNEPKIATFECLTCGVVETMYVIGDHKRPENVKHYAQTCEQDGRDEWDCANGCGYHAVENFKAKLVHNYTYEPTEWNDEGKVTKLVGTCTNPEETCVAGEGHRTVTYICKNAEKTAEVASTCSVQGYKEWTCTLENDSTIVVKEMLPLSDVHYHKVDGEDVPVVGPVKITAEDTWIYTIAGAKAACGKGAKGLFDCSVCGFPALIDVTADHVADPARDNSKDPTCETAGSYDYWCANCGEHVQEDNVPALGHEDVYSIVYDKLAEKFVVYKSCSRCDLEATEVHSISLEAAAEFKIADKCVAPTCETAGKDVYKITYKVGDEVLAEKEIEVTVPKTTGHQTEGDAIEWNVEVKDADENLIETIHYKGYYCKTCKKVVNVTKTVTPAEPAAPAEEPEDPTTNA